MDTDGGQAKLIDLDADLWVDALDVYFPAPLSLSLVANTFAHNGMQRQLGQLLDLHDGQVDEIVADVRRLGRPGWHLDVTAIAHHSVPGQEAMHLHVHVYVARTTSDPETGERTPLGRAELAAAAQMAWCSYSDRLKERTTEVLGFGWDPLPDDASTDQSAGGGDEVRVVGLPHAVHVGGTEFCVCHGYLGPHEQIVASGHR